MKKLAIAAIALCLMAGTATAGTVDVSNFTGVTANLSSAYATGDHTAGSVIVSDFQGLAPIPNGSAFVSFCVDLQHLIFPPLTDQNASLSLMSTWNGYGEFAPQANAGRYAAYLYNTYAGGLVTNDQRAGLALAIWEVLYDSGLNVSGGTGFSATSSAGAITAATGYLAGLQANLGAAALADAYWLRLYPVGADPNAAPQDFITGIPDGGMTLMLLGGALVGIGALRRKFRA